MIKILLLLFSTSLFAAPVKNCKVEFETTATPGLLNIHGEGLSCEGEMAEVKGLWSGSFKAKLSKVETGIALRNKHLKEKYLDVSKYPYAELAFKDQADDGELDASLTIKSDSKPVKVKYSSKEGKVHAKLSIEIKDFPGIGVPSYLGITAAGTANIDVELEK